MNVRIILCSILSGIACWASTPSPTKLPQKLIFIDGIQAVVRASEGTSLVMASELTRPRLDGSPNTLSTAVTNLVLENEAKRYRILPSPEENEKSYGMIAQSNGKTIKQLDEMVILAGFTPGEARAEFAQINAINSLIGFKVAGSLVVPESDVIAYYNDHPEIEPATYYLEYVVVPFAQNQTEEEQMAQLQKITQKNDPLNVLNWGTPFWIKESDISSDKLFITDLKREEISAPLKTSQGFELFRLKDKREERVKPLEERYGQIVAILRKPKYTELLENFQKGLFENASITYFDVPS